MTYMLNLIKDADFRLVSCKSWPNSAFANLHCNNGYLSCCLNPAVRD
jgi:hypothetical protein